MGRGGGIWIPGTTSGSADGELIIQHDTTTGLADGEYIAANYDTLRVGPRLLYTFEEQDSRPITGVNRMLRDLSPFTVRLVLPDMALDPTLTAAEVQSYARASDSMGTIDNYIGASSGNAVGYGTHNILPLYLSDIGAAIANGQMMKELSSTTDKEVATLLDPFSMLDYQYQIQAMAQFPPLTLLVNPEEFSITYNMIQDFAERGRNGLIFQRWGEQQPSVSIKGSTAAFMAGASPTNSYPQMTETKTPTGVQFAAKRNSLAFQHFTTLYHFYRSNGVVYDTVNGSEAHLAVGAIAIDYDQMTYVGHIESFNYSYEDATPNRIQWDMEFIVDRIYDWAVRPMVVLPMIAPQPNPSYPERVNSEPQNSGFMGATNTSDAKLGGWLGISGGESFGVSYTTNPCTGEAEAEVDLVGLREGFYKINPSEEEIPPQFLLNTED